MSFAIDENGLRGRSLPASILAFLAIAAAAQFEQQKKDIIGAFRIGKSLRKRAPSKIERTVIGK